jgi:large subunit ribosomal protein L15
MPLYRRIPKLKYFTVINRPQYTIINVGDLESLPAESKVTLESLMQAGIITSDDGPLKVLGDGDLTTQLEVTAAAFTASARAKVEAAGGTCKLLD